MSKAFQFSLQFSFLHMQHVHGTVCQSYCLKDNKRGLSIHRGIMIPSAACTGRTCPG
jgi:hypothetical protein